MPGLVVIRPADANETAYAWKFALEHRSGPTVLVLTRQKLPVLDQTKYEAAANLARGAYVVTGSERPQVILIGTGSELQLAIKAAEQLIGEGIGVRVVSMPSWELFEMQDQAYKDSVLPSSLPARVAVEAAVKMGWERYLGTKGEFVGMSSFGASAPAEAAFKGFGITVENVVKAAKSVILR
jgi:transketolase